ncbi:MAG: hypothetical protein EAX89_12310 [Candidatus Lokiarchaeota archaeon]|nr:hypothetical protein [Candidatus Lokiarchaeota archaeon]
MVLNIANNGKKKLYAPFLFFKIKTKKITITQKTSEIKNQGLKKNSKKVFIIPIYLIVYGLNYYYHKLYLKVKVIYFGKKRITRD